MALIVKKFGGSSVATTEKIQNVAKRVLSERKPGDKIVMVVSAMGDTTDELIKLARGITKDPYQYARDGHAPDNGRTSLDCAARDGIL